MKFLDNVTDFIIKRRYMLAVLAALLLALMTYMAASTVYWRELSSTTNNAKNATKDTLVMLQAADLNTDSIYELNNTLNEVGMCGNNLAITWQANLSPDKKAAYDECKSAADEANRQKIAINDIVSQLSIDTKLADIITNTSNQLKNVKSSEYDKCKQIWQQVINDINNDPELNQIVVAKNIAEKSQLMITAYDKLAQADQSQDRRAYDIAISEVGQIYGEVISLQTQAAEEYNQKAANLVNSYKQD